MSVLTPTNDGSFLGSLAGSSMCSVPSVSRVTLGEAFDGLEEAARQTGASDQSIIFLQAARARLFDDPKRYETVADLLELQDGERTAVEFRLSPEYKFKLSGRSRVGGSYAIHTLKVWFYSTKVSRRGTEPAS